MNVRTLSTHQGIPPTYYQPEFQPPPVYITPGPHYSRTELPQAHRSRWLLGFGIVDVCMSGIMFVWCVIVKMEGLAIASTYVALTCAAFHLILGVLSILGARDSIRYRGCLIASLVMGIVGPCTFVMASLIIDIIQWTALPILCSVCEEFDYSRNCSIVCNTFAAIIAYSVLQGIVSIVLSSIACCNICYCCGCCYMGDTPTQTVIYNSGVKPSYITLDEPDAVSGYSEREVESTLSNYK